MSAESTRCAMRSALGCLPEPKPAQSFSVGSPSGLGTRGGPACCPQTLPEEQKTKIQGYQFGSTCVTARAVGWRREAPAAAHLLQRAAGRGGWGAQHRPQTAPSCKIPRYGSFSPTRLCDRSFRCFYFCDVNLHKRLGSVNAGLPLCSVGHGAAALLRSLLWNNKSLCDVPCPVVLHVGMCACSTFCYRRWFEYLSVQ